MSHLDPYRESLVRAVPLDSLAQLYRTMISASDPKPIAREIVCEGMRLDYLYGRFIVSTAERRLSDTLFRRFDADAKARLDARLQGSMGPMRPSECHIPRDRPPAPDSLNYLPPVPAKKP